MLSQSEAGRFTSQFTTEFMNKKVSFAERLAQMQTAVTSLRAILEIVEREASAMAEVQQRFTARKPAQKRQATSAE